jgi:hypothetical protein
MLPMIGGYGLAASMATAGGFSSLLNRATDSVYIPERVEERREIMEQMDAVKYAKYKALYAETGDKQYLKMASRTITGTMEGGYMPDPKQAGFMMGKPESHYFSDIMENMTASDAQRIQKLLPDSAVPVMQQYLNQNGPAEISRDKLYQKQMGREIPDYDASIYLSEVSSEIPAIATFNAEGLNAHDAGMGWYSQVASMNRLKKLGVYGGEGLYADSGKGQTVGSAISKHELTSHVRNALQRFAKSINIRDDGMDRVELEIIL